MRFASIGDLMGLRSGPVVVDELRGVLVVLDELRRVAAEIDRTWSQAGFDLEAFPDVVMAKTEALDLSPLGALQDIHSLLADPQVAALQRPSTFSDLYLKVYDNGRFWVEILNWWGSDINIHDHDFSGVQFQLTGRSLNVLYTFDDAATVEGVHLGDVGVADAELWTEGQRSLVLPGRTAPHNVNHLDIPTVSLLIRTHPRPSWGPQWNYFAPGVASSYGLADIIFRKNIKALRLLSRGDHDVFHGAFRRFVADQDQAHLLFTLVKMIDIVFERNHVGLLHEIAEQDQVSMRVVEGVAFHRAAEMVKSFKATQGLSANDILVLSILGSSFDQRSANRIVTQLATRGVHVDLNEALREVEGRLASSGAQGLRNTMALYGVPQIAAPETGNGQPATTSSP